MMLAWALLAAAFVAPAWPLTAGDRARLEEGETLTRDFADGELRGSTLRFYVREDAPTCYRLLAHVPDMPRYMPGLRAVRVVEDRGAVKVLAYTSQVPLVEDFTLERHYEPPRRIWWTKIKAPYKRIEGEWVFAPAGAGAVVSYTLAVEAGNLVPNWLAAEFQKQAGSQLVRNVRKRIESGGKWVRPDYPGAP